MIVPAARRQLDRLRGPERVAMRGLILALGKEPGPPGALKLTGARDLWRIRVRIDGRAWRVVYALRTGHGLVVVTKVVRRDEGTYRRL